MKAEIENNQTLPTNKPITATKKGDDSKMKNEQNTTQPTTDTAPPANDKIEMLPVSKLEDFKSHPFNVMENEGFHKLMDSIKENGILIPAIARPKGDSYELIAGHRRKAVCEKLGINSMPVIIRDMTDEQSVIYMVDSNVQRENILPSEKAFAYKMKMDALKRQGQRSDLTSSSVATKSQSGGANSTSTPVARKTRGKETAEIIGEAAGESKDQVRRYIRLTELNPQLLKLVDEGKIGLRPAVELSFLTKPHQKLLLSVMESEQSTPSLAQAQKLKLYSLEGMLDESKVTSLIQQQKPNQQEYIKISCEKVRTLMKRDMSIKAIEELVFVAISDYQRKLQKQRSGNAR